MALRTLRNWLGGSTRKRTRRPAKRALALEHLEDRSTPAAIAWDGGAGNLNWFSPANWTGDVLPTLADDVTISGASGTVEINNTFGVATAHTLVSDSDLRVATGQLQLASDSVVNGNFTLGGVTFDGVVNGPGTLTINGNVTWLAGGVMAGTGKTILAGTSTMTGSTFGSIRESRVVENAGDATVTAGSAFTFRDAAVLRNLSGGTLTFASGAGIGSFFAGPTSKLVNEGTVIATGPGTTSIVVLTENTGTIDADGPLSLASLTNSGTINADGSTFSVSGGSNAGTIALGAATTMTAGGNFTLLSGSSITGGAVAVSTFNQLIADGTSSVETVRLTGGTLNALAGSNLTVGTLEHNGTVTGPGTVTVTDRWTFTNGSLTGGGRFVTEGTSTLSGGFFATIGNRTVENAGTALVDANQSFTFTSGGNWINLPGSVFELRTNSTASSFFVAATDKFTNQGTILKTGTGSATISLPVVNEASGTIQVTGGTLNLAGVTSAGNIDAASGAVLRLTGNTTLQAGATSTGAGEIQLAGNLTVAGPVALANLRLESGTVAGAGPLGVTNLTVLNSTVNTALNAQNLTFSGGTLTGTGTVTVGGALNWTAGTMSGTGRTVLNGTGTIAGNVGLDGRTVDNAGTMTVGAPPVTASVQFRNNAIWNNLPGAVLELTGTSSVTNFFASPTSAVNNAGTVRKSGAAGNVSSIAVPLINTGRLEVLGGDLTTAANSRHSGTADIATLGRWVLNNGVTFFDPGATTSGAGVLVIQSSANLTATGASTIARLQQTAGTVTANAPLTVGDYLFSGGTLTGTGRTTLTGMSSFTGTGTKVIIAHTVDNAGTVTWSQGSIQLTNGGVINNLVGGLFDITSDAAIAPSPFGGAVPGFNNAGTLRKSAGAGPIALTGGSRTTWNVPLTNTGTLDVRAGNFTMAPPTFGLPAGTAMLTNTGTIQIGTPTSSAASLALPGTGPVFGPTAFTLAAGTLTGTGLVGGFTNLTIAPGATLGGTLTVSGNVVNRGTVQPGTASGALTVTGNYTQVDDATADGRLVIGLRGDSASGMFGKLRVNGSSQLAGALEVFADGGFFPDFGDVFEVFRSIGARTGDFTYPAEGYDLDGYRVLTPEYDGTGLRLNLVTEVGALPVIDPIDDVTVDEGQTVSFTATVSGEEPPGPLTFSLAAGSSPGATIDPNTGAFEFFAAAGPGEYVFQIEAHDPNAPTDPVDVETFMVTVRNIAPVVALTGGEPELDEGDAFTADGSFTDPGADAWTATVDYGDGTGVQPLALNLDKSFALDHTYLDNGTFSVTVRVFDGHEFGTATFDVAVANLAPVVVAADDQAADENAAQEFAIGSFTDFGASDAPWTVSVNWGDGSDPIVFETMVQGPFDPLAHTYIDSGAYTVTVTVTDKDGAATSDTFEVVVGNLAPVAAVEGPSSGVRGQTRTFTLSATDASPVDQAAGFTFSINWGDGTTQEVTGASGTTVEHTYAGAGDYTVSVVATDKDGGASAPATHAITVFVAEVQDGVLVVGGTTGNDQIQLSGNSGNVWVTVNGTSLGSFDAADLLVYAQAGNDVVQVSGNFHDVTADGGSGNDQLQISGNFHDAHAIGGEGADQIQMSGNFHDVTADAGSDNDQVQLSGNFGGVLVDAGAGNDAVQMSGNFGPITVLAGEGDDNVQASGNATRALFFGSAGNDVLRVSGNIPAILDGGAGNDELAGGSGRDILIGGSGADQLTGFNGDDILIGGVFIGDEPTEERQAALLSVAAQWAAPQSYATRVAGLVGYLAPLVTDDGVTDSLTGSSSNDWYFARISGAPGEIDALNGVTSQETVTPI